MKGTESSASLFSSVLSLLFHSSFTQFSSQPVSFLGFQSSFPLPPSHWAREGECTGCCVALCCLSGLTHKNPCSPFPRSCQRAGSVHGDSLWSSRLQQQGKGINGNDLAPFPVVSMFLSKVLPSSLAMKKSPPYQPNSSDSPHNA